MESADTWYLYNILKPIKYVCIIIMVSRYRTYIEISLVSCLDVQKAAYPYSWSELRNYFEVAMIYLPSTYLPTGMLRGLNA